MTPFQIAEKIVHRNVRWVIFFSFVSNTLLLVVPIYMLQIYDRILHSGSLETLVVISFIVVCCIVLYGALTGALDLLLSNIGSYLAFQLSPNLLFSSPGAADARESVGQMSAHLEEIRRFFNSGAPSTLLSGLWIGPFLLVLFVFHPMLGLIGALGTAALLVIALFGGQKLDRRHMASLRRKQSSQSFMKCVLSQRDSVIALGMEKSLQTAWLRRYFSGVAAADERCLVSTKIRAMTRTVRLLVQVLLLGVGCALAIKGEISAGMIVAASIMMARALAPVENALGTWRSAASAKKAYLALRADFAVDQKSVPDFADESGSFVVRDLAIAPHEGKSASAEALFPPVSFSVLPGECLVIIGTVGCGKSLLLRSLIGLHPVLKGQISIAGQPVDARRPKGYGRLLGYTEAVPRFFPGTVAENICRFSACDVDELLSASRAARLHPQLLKLADGYDTSLDSEGRPLSSGQTRQVALARALYGRPRYLVLDDPVVGLDALEDAAFAQTVQELKSQGIALIIVTHSPRVLAQADKLLVIKPGGCDYMASRKKIEELLCSLKVPPSEARAIATDIPQSRVS